jgi:hypothetical protein
VAANFFDIQNGVLGTQNFGSGGFITPYGNGWYKVGFTQSLTSGNVYAIYGISNADDAFTNTASGTNGALIYGASLEEGAYATSYIPTLGSAVTRGEDDASKTGISSLIGVNGGSIFVEFDANGVNVVGANYLFDLSDGTNFDANRISMYWTSSSDLVLFYGYGGTYTSEAYTSSIATTKKVGVRWTSTQIQAVINGVAQTAVTYGNSSPTKLNIASRFNNIEQLALNAKQCILFNTTLTAAQLAELTTI